MCVLADILGASPEGGCEDLIGRRSLATTGGLLAQGAGVPIPGPGAAVGVPAQGAAVPRLGFDRVVGFFAQGALIPSCDGPRADASCSDKPGPSLIGWCAVCTDAGGGLAFGS